MELQIVSKKRITIGSRVSKVEYVRKLKHSAGSGYEYGSQREDTKNRQSYEGDQNEAKTHYESPKSYNQAKGKLMKRCMLGSDEMAPIFGKSISVVSLYRRNLVLEYSI